MPGGPEGPFEQQPYGFQPPEGYTHPDQGREPRRESERFYTILLSFVPGLGHLHLGLLQRGLSFLIGFFGLGIMLVFVAGITGQETVLVFLLLLPVLWLYCMFDAAQHVNRKQAGELLEDKTIFEQLEHGRGTGKKARFSQPCWQPSPEPDICTLDCKKRAPADAHLPRKHLYSGSA